MRNRILFAAAQEINTRGVKFTVDSVALRMGISKKTLYQHFSSKDELITAVIDAALKDIADQQKEIIASTADFPEKLQLALTVEPKTFGKVNDWVLEDIKRFRPDDWRRIDSFRRKRIDIVAGLLEAGIASGHIREVNVRTATQMLFGAVSQILDYGFLEKNNITFTDALKTVTDIFQHGVLKEGR